MNTIDINRIEERDGQRFTVWLKTWKTVFGEFAWGVICPTGDGMGGFSKSQEEAERQLDETLTAFVNPTETNEPCLYCNGTGKETGLIEMACDVCTAFGLIEGCSKCGGFGYYMTALDCRFCGGAGR